MTTRQRTWYPVPPATLTEAAICLWDVTPPWIRVPTAFSPYAPFATPAMSSLASFSAEPVVRIVSICSTVLSGFSQPSGIGRVMPLSWSTSTVGSPSSGEGLSSGVPSVPVAAGGGAALLDRACGRFPPSSLPSSTAPVTAAQTTTAPATTSAMIRPLPLPPSPGPAGAGA